ncbi:MAG: DNA-directed DNA polymerase I [Fervidicoccaceae archaeon]
MTYAAKKKRNNTTLMDFIRKDEEKKIGGDAKAIAMELANSSKEKSNSPSAIESKNEEKNERGKFIVWFSIVDEAIVEEGHLLSYYYDPDRNAALLCFYDEKKKRLAYWYDKTQHKPYFIVAEEPEEVERKLLREKSKEAVYAIERIEKINPLTMKREKFTKIVVNDPLAVRELRGIFKESWESKIKYHQNFIYDRGLIPGYKYKVSGKTLSPVEVSISSKDELKKVFEGESEEVKRFAEELSTLFELSPPLPSMVAIDVEVFSPYANRLPNVATAPYPILSIALVGNDGMKKVLALAYPHASKSPIRSRISADADIEVFDSERAMLLEAFRIIGQYQVIYSYNGDNFDLPYMRNRARVLGFKPQEVPIKEFQEYYTLKGGIHIDLYKVFENKALKTYAFGGNYRENTLDSVAQSIIGIGKVKIDENPGMLGISKLIEYNLRDAEITLSLATWKSNLTWKLLILLSRLTKTGIEELSRTQISNWIRNMLYWEHRRRNYLIPRQEDILQYKREIKSKAVIKGKKYAGAIVLDPPVGVFFNILVLDFASLYPSIMKVWNLSYETVNPSYDCKNKKEIPDVKHVVCMDKKGMTSLIIGTMRDLRVKVYKKKGKEKGLSAEQKEWYNAVQSALKVLLNASYGVFGSDAFSLYAPPVAESVTAIGRFTIMSTIKKAVSLGLKVLYGDTDSMFIWNPEKESLSRLISEVEKEFSLDLDVDKEFRYVAFSGLKKNYLAVTPGDEIVIKGLLGKKRNQPEFLKNSFNEVISLLKEIKAPSDFTKVHEQIRGKVKDIYRKLKGMGFMLDELAFNVMLNKDIDGYVKNTPQHVKAAMLLKNFDKKLVKGDIISYVKVKGKDGVKPVSLAKLSEVDVDKYLEITKTTFEQVLRTINISWEDIEGMARLESFFNK